MLAWACGWMDGSSQSITPQQQTPCAEEEKTGAAKKADGSRIAASFARAPRVQLLLLLLAVGGRAGGRSLNRKRLGKLESDRCGRKQPQTNRR